MSALKSANVLGMNGDDCCTGQGGVADEEVGLNSEHHVNGIEENFLFSDDFCGFFDNLGSHTNGHLILLTIDLQLHFKKRLS